MNQGVADKLAKVFEGITGIEVSRNFMVNGPTHNPTSLQNGMCGVYAFVSGEHCFKVGVEVEVFHSGGPDSGLEGEEAIERLFREFSE